MKNLKTKTGKLSSEQLRKALYAFQDLTERLQGCPFYPLKATAKCISDNPDAELEGDKIYVGIKKGEWTRSRQSTFQILSKHLKFEYTETDKGYEFELEGVPIELTIINKKYKFFSNPNITFWGVGEFLMPNPIDTYLKSQHLVR